MASVRDAAMDSDWSWQRLEELTDRIGPRLSGSPQHAAAIAQLADAMRALGAEVRLQPAKVPHWVRGEEHAELIDYPGRPPGVTQALHLTALGGSSATAAAGLTARVIVVHDFDELQARSSEVRGNIVLFEARFDQRLADNGEAMAAYLQAGQYRFIGPSTAAALGAAAALVRSVGGADYRLPHTGATAWKDKQAPIPAAALAAEDADLITRLAAQGPVSMKLLLTARMLPDADSANVIADWPGSERPDEYVVVSGHLDSWDLATGATDDGVGVMAAAGVIQVLQQLNVHARRTIRFIGWTNEENGGRGHTAYFDSVRQPIATQCAAIESDFRRRPLARHRRERHAGIARDAAAGAGGAGADRRQRARAPRRRARRRHRAAAGRGRAGFRAAGRYAALFRLSPHRRRHARQGRSAKSQDAGRHHGAAGLLPRAVTRAAAARQGAVAEGRRADALMGG